MINIQRISQQAIQTEPFNWAAIDNLYSPDDATALASTFPHGHFKTVVGNDGEKVYKYEVRSLVAMGSNTISFPEELSDAWLDFANALISPAYRAAMSRLTGYDLTAAPIEVNLFHYGPGASLGPHLDLSTKLVTHAIYFNQWWDAKEGGCLNILRSSDPKDVAVEILPVVGNSAVIVRSEKSWHAVSPVVEGCSWSRRSLTATFYQNDSPSSMWVADDSTALHHYDIPDM